MAKGADDKLILVVDDDADLLSAMTAALGDTKARIKTASDGNTAVTIAERDNPDVVVLDIMLPQRSGFLVLERLRQGRAPGEKPRVIMITGNQGKRHKQYAEALGVDCYLNKPFAMDQLVEIAEELLAAES